MKLQHLMIIFVIIVLPLTLILSAYTSTQIDTLSLQNQYDIKLMDATYDGIKAFEINTSYNDFYDTTDALKEDVEAAISAFMQSLAVNLGIGGYNQDQIKSYIPAILFTLYDGYYIYAPTRTNSGYEYILQPYSYYTIRYKQNNSNDVVINYTLDNYIVVYGWIEGKYVVNSGYLISNDRTNIVGEESLSFQIPIAEASTNNVEGTREIEVTNKNEINSLVSEDKQLYPDNESFYIDPESAKNYYAEAEDFTNWVNRNLNWVQINMAMRNNTFLKELSDTNGDFDSNDKVFDFKNSDPEDPNSAFSDHKTNVISYSIQDSLKQAITAYSQGSTVSYDFKLPKLDVTEWSTVSSNICMLAFMQGLPCGTKYYNNYVLVTSGTNKLYKTQNSLYFMTEDDEYYHKIDCPKLGENNLVGYPAIDYEPKRYKIGDNYQYYYRHLHSESTPKKACYYCIVNSNYESEKWETNEKKEKAYYTALAREKYNQYKATKDLKYDEKAQAN